MSISVAADIHSFFVFNPSLGEEDSEGEKILGFYPELDMNTQKDYVGFCEGIFNFSQEFSKTEPLRYVETGRFRYILYTPEKDYWVVLMINRSSIASNVEDDSTNINYSYQILSQFYLLFYLYNGGFDYVMRTERRAGLRWRLSLLQGVYLPRVTLKPYCLLPFLNTYNMIQLERTAALTVEFLASSLSNHFQFAKIAFIAHESDIVYSQVSHSLLSVFLSSVMDNGQRWYSNKTSQLEVPDIYNLPYKVKQHKAPWIDMNASPCPPIKAYTYPPEKHTSGFLLPDTELSLIPRVWLQSMNISEQLYPNTDILASYFSHYTANTVKDTSVLTSEGEQALLIYQHDKMTIALLIDAGPLDSTSAPDCEHDLSNRTLYEVQPDKHFLSTGYSLRGKKTELQNIQQFLQANVMKISSIVNTCLTPSPSLEVPLQWIVIDTVNLAIQSNLANTIIPENVAKTLNHLCTQLRTGAGGKKNSFHLKAAVENYYSKKMRVFTENLEKEKTQKEVQDAELAAKLAEEKANAPEQEEEDVEEQEYLGEYVEEDIPWDQTDFNVEWGAIFAREATNTLEIYAKTNKHWVVARKAVAGQREFYFILDDRNAPSITDAYTLVDNASRKLFSNVFIF